MPSTEYQLSSQEIEARSKIGRRIVYWALGAVSVLGVVAMGVSCYDKSAVTPVKDILAMLLPMIGAWVGTVLAFYFSKENYAAAAQNSAQMLGLTLDQRLQSTSVQSVMIPIAQVDNRLVLQKPAAQLKIKGDVLDQTAGKTGRNRILLLDATETVQYVVHRSVLDKFVSERAFSGVKVEDLTLADFLADASYQQWATSFGAIGLDSKLSDVKAVLDANPKCSDVIVTSDGGRASKAVGWVTNAIVLEKSRA